MNTLTYVLNLKDNMTASLRKMGVSAKSADSMVKNLNKSVNTLNKTPMTGLSKSFGDMLKAASPMILLTAGMVKLKQAIGASEDAYKAAAVAERQLTQVMGNTMNATQGQVQEILNLTAAQQKLGVISADVQTAGAQELATYLEKTESLKTILPVMNDMLAQQYGLNASQEQAANIASMLGKVMDGQVGALSKYGYKFDDAQEKILKFGTEAQRAAVLADVVSGSVGGMNAALANTKEGKLKQQANTFADIMAQVGKQIMGLQSAFSGTSDTILRALSKIMSFLERNESKIHAVANAVSNVLAGSIKVLGNIVLGVYRFFASWNEALQRGHKVIVPLTAALVGMTAVIIAMKTWSVAITVATVAWTTAQWLLNAALTANPVGLIIAGVVALIALIGYLIVKIDGWGETWQNLMTFGKLAFEAFTTGLKTGWLAWQHVFMTGLETVQKGWYKLKGLWDSDAAAAGLAEIEGQRNKRLAELATAQAVHKGVTDELQNMEVWKLKMNDKSLGGMMADMKSKLGISEPGLAGSPAGTMGNAGTGLGTSGGTGTGGLGANEMAKGIATGGNKTNNITITLGELVGTVNISKEGFRESAESMRDIVLDEMTRVLTMAQR